MSLSAVAEADVEVVPSAEGYPDPANPVDPELPQLRYDGVCPYALGYREPPEPREAIPIFVYQDIKTKGDVKSFYYFKSVK